jgi:hemin uptake protein HemP
MTDQKPLTVQLDPSLQTLPTYQARDLVDQGTQARIVLDEQVYTLRITRAGKLILTK